MKRSMICFLIFCFIFGMTGFISAKEMQAPEFKVPAKDVLQSVDQELITATVGDPKTFNPITSSETSSSAIYGFVFEGLIEQNPFTLEFEPNLAKKWEVDESGLVWTFYLRDDVLWNDGKHKFSAKDVLFTLNAIYGVPNGMQDILTIDGKKIEAKVIDDYTIKFILPVKFAPFLSVMQWSILPEFVLGKSLQDGTFENQWSIATSPEKLIGTGPYKLVEYESAQHAKYIRNPHYWKKDEQGNQLPYIKKRTVLIVQDANTAFLKFKNSETHFYSPSPEYVAELEDGEDALGIRVEEIGIGLGVEFLTFNRNSRYYIKKGKTDPKLNWFSDKEFLKAVSHSIDKESIIISVLYGMGEIAPAIVAPSNYVFTNSSLKDYEYDPELAEEILDKAGYVDTDDDGIREDKDGNKLEFDLSTNAGNNTREKLCSMIKQDLEDVGIKVNFRPLEFNTLVQKLMDNYEWDAIVIGLTGGSEPHNGANVYKSGGKLHMWNPAQEKAATKWEEEIDDLIIRGVQELDLKKRVKIYHRLQEILHQELPFIVMPRSLSYTAYSQNIENYFITVFGTYKAERMFFKK